MKKLIVKIGNETHELPYNGEVFSFEISEKYVPKVGDCVKIYFKKVKYEYFGKINQIAQKEIRLRLAIDNFSRVMKNLSLDYDTQDIFFTQITPEELKAKYAEAGYDWDYETNDVKPLKWMPKNGDKVWWVNYICETTIDIFTEDAILKPMAEKGFLFQPKPNAKILPTIV